MHSRSLAASAPANAQQQPQFDWSRMSLITLLHAAQFSAESNELGKSSVVRGRNRSTSPCDIAIAIAIFTSPFTPFRTDEIPGANAANRATGPAFHSFVRDRISAISKARNGCTDAAAP
mmetsp:Transcript_7371/g.22445  ORF Transcript_7371/g.22445 Transcript_7371/m.22445 type:complete len:119 (-) Transcript_7371:86-442(-)